MGKVEKAKVKETSLLSCLSHNFLYHLFFEKSQSPNTFVQRNIVFFDISHLFV